MLWNNSNRSSSNNNEPKKRNQHTHTHKTLLDNTDAYREIAWIHYSNIKWNPFKITLFFKRCHISTVKETWACYWTGCRTCNITIVYCILKCTWSCAFARTRSSYVRAKAFWLHVIQFQKMKKKPTQRKREKTSNASKRSVKQGTKVKRLFYLYCSAFSFYKWEKQNSKTRTLPIFRRLLFHYC